MSLVCVAHTSNAIYYTEYLENVDLEKKIEFSGFTL